MVMNMYCNEIPYHLKDIQNYTTVFLIYKRNIRALPNSLTINIKMNIVPQSQIIF